MTDNFVIIVGCSKRKKSYTCPAEEMYSESQLFSKTIKYIKNNYNCSYKILSAKYGIISPDTIIEPYDVTINSPLSIDMLYKIRSSLDSYDKVIALCGSGYVKIIRGVLPTMCIVEPMKGLGIGKRLQYLNGVNRQ